MFKHLVSVAALFGFLLPVSLSAQDTHYEPKGHQIPAAECQIPTFLWLSELHKCTPADHDAWLADIRHWRSEHLLRVGFNSSEYDRPELQWTQSSFVQPQAMVEDRFLYDPATRRYTVDRYLDDLDRRYGGIDAVLLWHTYPNIGVDSRNQYDLLRDMPGGVDGVRSMIADFHRRGVRVLFPIMMWDQGTRDEGEKNWIATAKLMAQVGADGINGDTLEGINRKFREASDAIGHPLVLQPEGGPDDEALQWNNMTWGQFEFPWVPLTARYKWLETRHMINISDRWNRDKTDDLQFAFFNGVGWESWENVWGVWNGITPRDGEALRRVSRVERAMADFLVSPDWEPYAPTLRFGIFASKWPRDGQTLWTVVNRNQYSVNGAQLQLPYDPKVRYFDLWHGIELHPQRRNDSVLLSFDLEPNGFGAVFATTAPLTEKLSRLLSDMHTLSQTSLQSLSHEWKPLAQKIVEIDPAPARGANPSRMVRIPAGEFLFQVNGIEIEGRNDIGLDVQYPWEDSPRRHHEQLLSVPSFWIDAFPVTNQEFKQFLDATHYHPADDHNFLRHWSNGEYPVNAADQPVVWVSLEDARAYAAWAGKRLPHEWEWQYAAQGADGRLYPWGNEWNPAVVPTPDRSRSMRLPTSVNAYPLDASPFGVHDLVGNVWQWTDEFSDEHTRAAVLKGGSFYQPQGSRWYFPQAYKLTEHGKYLLLSPGSDRSGSIGFRCVADAR